MRPTKPVLVLAAIAIAAVAAFVLVWAGSRTGFARRWAGERLAETVGLPVTIGELQVGILPRLEVTVGQVMIAQPEGFGPEPLIELGQATLAMPWTAWFGAMTVHSLSIEDPVVRLAVAGDGRDNWSALVERLTGPEDEEPTAWSLDQLLVERGALEYRDLASAATSNLTAITINATKVAPGKEFPLELRLAGITGSGTYHFGATGRARLDPEANRYAANGLTLRGWAGGEPLPLAGVELAGGLAAASYDSAAGTVRFEAGRFAVAGVNGRFEGDGRFGEVETELRFSVETDPFAPRPAANAFGRPLPETADPKAYGQAQFSLRGELAQGGLRIDPIQGQLDDTRFSGHAVPSQRLLRLHADRVAVDRYLAPSEKTRREKKETLEAAITRLGTFDVDAEIRIDEARVAGAALRNTVVRIERVVPAGP